MKYFIYTINCLLVIMIPMTFVLNPVTSNNTKKIATNVDVKQLKSKVLTDNDTDELEDKNINLDLDSDDTTEVIDCEDSKVKKEVVKVEKTTNKEVVEYPKSEQTPISDVLETQVGSMSGYGPDCKGCSGYLASGRYVGSGNIYYDDSTYGKIRIVAGDYNYKMGTIVRIKNSKAGNNILAIVLDRGSSIGFGKKFLFDLLYKSEKEAIKDEVSYNTTFEILRYGY